ncbi:hypothetical protein PVAP13_2KG423105 [Panicum virgatum]|uniref:Ubiquitin-related modifier 1 n=1 Tax=Panicum virgatum TaxID=38727 RepID=A0A8T0WDG9_PANVG|nr:hypothetical protein PVAP13_2KG423105 [Panicum virgatum]
MAARKPNPPSKALARDCTAAAAHGSAARTRTVSAAPTPLLPPHRWPPLLYSPLTPSASTAPGSCPDSAPLPTHTQLRNPKPPERIRSPSRPQAMHLTLEFGGGLELLLENSTKVHKVEVSPKDGEGKVTMKGLLSWVKANLIKERPEMFVKGDSVRPGVLVLINDCD